MARKKPYRIFELDFFIGMVIMSMFLFHIVSFITHYLGVWGVQISEIDAPEFFYRFGFNFVLLRMGITLTFSRHNANRGLTVLTIYMVSVIISFLLYYRNSVYNHETYNDVFLFLDYTMFWYYAVYILLFMWIIKMPFNFQFYIFLVLLVLGILSFIGFNMPSINPLEWYNIIMNDPIDHHINMPADKKEYLLFPGIVAFALGTLIGQIYYRNKISPLVFTEKYSDFMQKYKPTRFVMWCGANSLKCFVAQAVILPIIFGVITLIFRLL